MLIQRVEIRNFLKHQTNGTDSGFVAIDFRSSPLWLIHGPNGAGKSAIFDAITFALFSRHRGSGSRDGKLHRLINDNADQAEINLEIELGGHRFLVQRKITRKGRKGNNGQREGAEAWGIVRQWIGDGWKAVPGTEKRVEEWVQMNLRMSYETFVSAVLLRQGEADTFLKAKPADRKTRLLELLDLEFYERLGEAANRRQNDWRKERDRCQKEIERLTPISEADIVQKTNDITRLEEISRGAGNILANKEAKLRNAQRADSLNRSIKDKEKQRRDDAKVVSKKDQILSEVLRYRDLQSALPLISNVWDARQQVTAETQQIKEVEGTLTSLRQDLESLRAKLDVAVKREESANLALSKAIAKRDQATKDQSEVCEQVRELAQIESLEGQLGESQAMLSPVLAVLSDEAEIEHLANRYESLKDALPLLEALNEANAELIRAEGSVATAQASLKEHELLAANATAEEQKVHNLSNSAVNAFEATQQSLNQVGQKLSILRERLERRNKITGQDECPVCGSALDTPEALARLDAERSHSQRDVGDLEQLEIRLSEELAGYRNAKTEAASSLHTAIQSTRRAHSELAVAQRDFEAAQTALASAQRILDREKSRSGEWADKHDQLPKFRAELKQLSEVPDRVRRLQRARESHSAITAVIKTHQAQLDSYPTWAPVDRELIRSRSAEAEQMVAALQSEVTTWEAESEQTKSTLSETNRAHGNLEHKIDLETSRLTDLQGRKQQADREVLRRQKVLPPTWKDHLCLEKRSAWEELQDELKQLSQAESRERELRLAEKRSDELDGAIRVLTEELGTIPPEHGCSVSTAEVECTDARQSVQRAEKELTNTNNELIELIQKKATFEHRQDERDNAEREHSYYIRLATAFGRSGLQAAVVKTAQEAVTTNANATLGRLTRGIWKVELEENLLGTELEILARDLSQPNAPLRPFAFLSGGEKFRVAISLAVGVGQSVSGGRTVDTLIIDEGFGALDEVNRGLLIGELSRLSEEVLQGGRVIVVSHQDDVCEEFANRYHVFDDVNGVSQLQASLP